MITNDDIADILKMTGQLLELHGENSFKVNAYTNASFRIDKYPDAMTDLAAKNLLGTVDGLGSSMKNAVKEIIDTGTLAQLEHLLQNTPAGVLEMLKIKGIGPKKVAVIWHAMGITTPGELLYACVENRLMEVKGFGAKTQESIRKAIEFKLSHAGHMLYARAWQEVQPLLKLLQNHTHNTTEICGELRRTENYVSLAEFILPAQYLPEVAHALQVSGLAKHLQMQGQTGFSGTTENGLPLALYTADDDMQRQVFLRTATPAHLSEAGIDTNADFQNAAQAYAAVKLPLIPDYLQAGGGWVDRIRNHGLPTPVERDHLKGVLHVHTTWSDGASSVKDMAKAAQKSGYHYLGITDHSKSAFYAKGLSEGRIQEQHKEIDALNAASKDFKIFKGIESDILGDGSLDYEDAVLNTFDFIIASVHAHLNMQQDKAMMRLINAIQNPYTTMLGHPTGRLLLARQGYPIDHKAIIDACALHNVVIELNANPYRLDLDWTWLPYAMDKGVMISINPDAHSIEGYEDVHWGLMAARKGMLKPEFTFNTLDTAQIDEWFRNKKKR
jgi:DNA polymerase (family 10)